MDLWKVNQDPEKLAAIQPIMTTYNRASPDGAKTPDTLPALARFLIQGRGSARMPKRSIQAFRPQGSGRIIGFTPMTTSRRSLRKREVCPTAKLTNEVLIDDAKGFRREAHRVPRRQTLRERLEKAAHIYIVFSEYQTEPTPNQIADAMADIEEAAATLITALHLPEAME